MTLKILSEFFYYGARKKIYYGLKERLFLIEMKNKQSYVCVLNPLTLNKRDSSSLTFFSLKLL